MSSRLATFNTALQKCKDLRAKYPALEALQSVELQLEYLIGLESGAHSDRSRLRDITIGVLTAREIEPLDDEAAEMFYQVAGEASRM